jgi:hypothetical protein
VRRFNRNVVRSSWLMLFATQLLITHARIPSIGKRARQRRLITFTRGCLPLVVHLDDLPVNTA